MARISGYGPDTDVTKNDKLFGSDSGGTTRNYRIQDVSKYLRDNNTAGVAQQATYLYTTISGNNQPTGSLYINGSTTVAFSGISTVKVSEFRHGDPDNTIKDLLLSFKSNFIIIHDLDNPNNFGIYTVSNVVKNGNYCDFTLSHESSSGSITNLDSDNRPANKYYGFTIYGTGGDITDVTSSTTDQLTVTNSPGPAPALSIVTGAIANGGTGLATADQIHTFVTGQTDAIAASTTGNAATATKIASITNSDIVQLTSSQTLTNKILTSPVINTGISGTAIKDEDNMSSNSATHLATQQSIKAYVDAQVASENTIAELNDATIGTLANGHLLLYDNDSSVWENKALSGDATITKDGALTLGTVYSGSSSVGSSTAIPVLTIDGKGRITGTSTAAISSTLTVGADSGSNDTVTIGTDTLDFSGGTGIDTTVSDNDISIAIDSTVTTLTGSQTLTNKTLTSPILNTGVSGTAVKDEDNMASNSATHLATQQSIKAYVDSQVDTVDTLSEVLAIGNTTGGTKIEVDNTSGGIDFIDNAKLRVGTGDDLEIYHDGSNSYIQNQGGDLAIRNTVSQGDINFESDDGNGGTTAYMFINGTNRDVRFLKHSKHIDNKEAQFGTTTGLVITHNPNNIGGAASFISNSVGDLYIRNSADNEDIKFWADDGSGLAEYFRLDGGDGEVVFSRAVQIDSTVTVGVNDTGYDVKFFGATSGRYLLWDESDDSLNLADNTKLKIGTSGDLELYHDTSNSYIVEGGTGDLIIQSTNLKLRVNNTENAILCDANAGVTLYYDGGARISATNAGATVTGALTVTTDIDVDGTANLDAVDIDGAVQLDGTFTVGVDDTGYDVKFFGDTASKYLLWDASADKLIATGEIEAGSLDISGNVDIDGTLEADAITVNGTALDTHIAGVTVTNATNAAHVLVTDNESTDEENLITFVEGATSSTGNVGLEMDGNLTYNPSSGKLTSTSLSAEGISATNNLTTALTQLQGNLNILNKAQTSYIGLATRNTSGSEVVYDLTNVGNVTTSGYLRGPSSFTIDPATHGDDTGTVVIAGNLQVDGTTTTINSTTVAIDDLNFSIATDAADSAAANGAGITIGGAGATLIYTHATTSWDMNKPLNVTGDTKIQGSLSITGDGSNAVTLTESGDGDFTIDAVGDIAIDADGGDIRLKDGSVGTFGAFTNTSSNFEIRSSISDKDIIFKGNDAGSVITALTLDMSEGGNATFGGKIQVGAISSGTLNENTGVKLAVIGDGGDNNDGLIITRDNGSQNQLDQFINIYNDGTSTFVASGGTSTHGSFDFKSTNDKGDSSVSRLSINSSGNATFAGDITVGDDLFIADGGIINVGTGNDLNIQHDGTDSIINNNTGHLYITNYADNKDIYFRSDDGSGGVATYFYVSGSAEQTVFVKNTNHPDGTSAYFGNSNDLRIVHTSDTSYITNNVGDLEIIQNTDDGQIKFYNDDGSGGTELYLTIDGNNQYIRFDKDARFDDNEKIELGIGGDFQLYHTGSDSYVKHYTGTLYIEQHQDDGNIRVYNDDGSGGIAEYIRVDGTNHNTAFFKDLKIHDNVNLLIGSGDADFQLYHTGTVSYIRNNIGNLEIRNQTDAASDILVKTRTDSGLETFITLDGSAALTQFDKHTKHVDSIKADFGSSSDLQIHHDGTNSFIVNNTGVLYIRNTEDDNDICFQSDNGSGSTATYFFLDGDNVETTFLKRSHHMDGVEARFGDGADLKIYHDSSNSYVDHIGTGDLILRTSSSGDDVFVRAMDDVFIQPKNGEAGVYVYSDGAVELYYDNSKKLETTSAGVSVTGNTIITDTANPDGGSGAGEGGSLIVEGRRDGTANLISLRARDASAPTVALPNDQGGLIRWQGFDGTDFAQMGAIAVVADGQAVANSDAPSKMIFYTTADGSETLTTALTLDKSQNATFAGTIGSGNINISDGTPVLTLTDTSSSATVTHTLDGVNYQIANNGTSGNFKLSRKVSTTERVFLHAHDNGNLILYGNGSTAQTISGANTTFAGNILASADSSHDIGTSSVRFANVYADTLYGDGSNITGVTGEWDGTHTGNATITGNLDVSGSITASIAQVNNTANGNFYTSSKSVTLTENTFTDVLTINMVNHTACYIKIFVQGDWNSHSTVAFLGEYFLQNSAGSYNEPGMIIREVDNTHTDAIVSKIVDPSGTTGTRAFTIQLKADDTINANNAPVTVTYTLMGAYNSIS